MAWKLALVLSLVTVGCASHSGGTSVDLPSFRNVSEAPAVIQTAARAVVRIGTNAEFATGSFISPTGLLLTNNHVLGVDICPIEGCFAQITSNYQRNSPPTQPTTVFVVPMAVDVGLDMAVVQAFSADHTQMLSSPDYLTISSRDPASLRGTHVNVIGHPLGHLKKWTQGVIFDSDGTWIQTSAYSLPGNSGSPFLDDEGQLVGILHRGPSEQDLVSSSGVDEYSIGTASSALIPAMKVTALPAAMRSTAASTTDDDVVEYSQVYLNARTVNANVNGMPKPVITSLAAACDAGLARNDYESPEDLASAVSACTEAALWIKCTTPLATDGTSVCPDDTAAWTARYQGVYDHYVALNGSLMLGMVTTAMAGLSSTTAAGTALAAQNLQHALAAANPPFDFEIASYLAAFGVNTYAGTTTQNFLLAYKNVPDYALSGEAIVATAVVLTGSGALGISALRSLLNDLSNDPTTDIGTNLYIEDIQYQVGFIN